MNTQHSTRVYMQAKAPNTLVHDLNEQRKMNKLYWKSPSLHFGVFFHPPKHELHARSGILTCIMTRHCGKWEIYFMFVFFLRSKHVLLSCMQVMFVGVLNFPSVLTQLLLLQQFHGRVINNSEWSLCTLSLLLSVWIMCHETIYNWSPVKSYGFWFGEVWSYSLLTNLFNRPTYHSLG